MGLPNTFVPDLLKAYLQKEEFFKKPLTVFVQKNSCLTES